MNDRVTELGRVVSAEELKQAGIEARKGASPADRYSDGLDRHLSVPNRMMIFYSSDDEILATYIRDHWNSLDGLSGEVCDIYPSLLQLIGEEDVYTYLKELTNIPGIEQIRIKDLPSILIWSDSAFAVFSINGPSRSVSGLRTLFRRLFDLLHSINRGLEAGDGPRLRDEVATAMRETGGSERISIYIDQRSQHTYTATEGSIVVGAGATGRSLTAQRYQTGIDNETK